MKEKIYYLSLFFCISIIILTIFKIISLNNKVYIPEYKYFDNKYFDEKLSRLKSEIDNLEDSECKDLISKLATTVEKSNFKGYVKIKDLYSFYWFSSFEIASDVLLNGKEKCNMIDFSDFQIVSKIAIDETSQDLIVHDIISSYEISINDPLRQIAINNERNYKDVNAIKLNRLSLLEELINSYKKGGINNES